MTLYLSADVAKTGPEKLTFPGDPKSQRALAASQASFDANSDKVQRETLFQIAFLENVSHSLNEQLDELQAGLDIEGVGADRLRYGRQRVVRQVDFEDNEDQQQQLQQQQQLPRNGINNANSTFKLTLQDCSGNIAYAVELEKLAFLSAKSFPSGFPLQLGSKLLVKAGTDVFRGVILLERDKTEYLGGIVPEWNQDTHRRHVAYLQQRIAANE